MISNHSSLYLLNVCLPQHGHQPNLNCASKWMASRECAKLCESLDVPGVWFLIHINTRANKRWLQKLANQTPQTNCTITDCAGFHAKIGQWKMPQGSRWRTSDRLLPRLACGSCLNCPIQIPSTLQGVFLHIETTVVRQSLKLIQKLKNWFHP